jgi:hypothetical protein
VVIAEFSSVTVSVPEDAVADVVPVLTVRTALTAGRLPSAVTHENGVADVTLVVSVLPLPEHARELL